MSLDVYLETGTAVFRRGSGIFVREDGAMKEITREEWDERNPGHEPVVMRQPVDSTDAFSANITHNLVAMADAAGIYKAL